MGDYERESKLNSRAIAQHQISRWEFGDTPPPISAARLLADIAAFHAEAVAEAQAWSLLEERARGQVEKLIGDTDE